MEQVVTNEANGSLKAQFSFYMSVSKDYSSKLVFGDYDLPKYAKKGSTAADIVWFDVTTDNEDMWGLDVASINFEGGKYGFNVNA